MNHKRLTTAAIACGALMVASLIGPFSDRTFYCFLVAFVGFSVLAIAAADRKTEQILVDELDPQPADFAADLVPARHTPALYDLTVSHYGSPPAVHRNLTTFELTRQLLDRDVPGYLACEESGDTTVNGSRITWQPSTHTTGDNR